MNKRVSWRFGRGCGLALLSAVLGTPALAQEAEKVAIHGSGGVAFGVTDEPNAYLSGTPDRSLDTRELSLTILATPSERLLVGAQAYWGVRSIYHTDDLELNLNLAFAQYTVSDALKIRAGMSRQPFGLYSETLEVGTLRPFLSLPVSVYSPGTFQAEGYRGVGLTGVLAGESRWPLEYDVYAGELELLSTTAMNPVFGAVIGEQPDQELKDMFGGRLRLRPPVSGLTLGASAYTANPEQSLFGQVPLRQKAFLASVEMLRERWLLRGEYARRTTKKGKGSAIAAYVQAAVRPVGKWEIAAQWDWLDVDLGPAVPLPPFLVSIFEHRDLALGLNYHVAAGLVFKASVHDVRGNTFAVPVDGVDFTQGRALDRTTRLFQLGAQFSF